MTINTAEKIATAKTLLQSEIDRCAKELAAMPDERDVLNTARAQEEHWLHRNTLMSQQSRAKMGLTALVRHGDQCVSMLQQEKDLIEIREQLYKKLHERRDGGTGPLVLTGLARTPLELSVKAIDGLINIRTEPLPTAFPLFDELRLRGYVPPPSETWNFFAALFGSLPAIQQRLDDIRERFQIVEQLVERLSTSAASAETALTA